MNAFKGEVKWLGHVVNDDGNEFYKQVSERVEGMSDLYCEIQYAPQMHLNGKVLYCAFIIGRARHDQT
jgi:hypothetical protein